MKIRLLIVTDDKEYAKHFSDVLSEKHADKFEVVVCSSVERAKDMLVSNAFDSVLIETGFVPMVDLSSTSLPLVLWDEAAPPLENCEGLKKIRKYQRISSMVGEILENYAKLGFKAKKFDSEKANITAVWSPHGGVGKSTVALAFAVRKISNGMKAVYLNLESFSSTSVYFNENEKSISAAFEKLDSSDSNVDMILLGIRQQDSNTGITYFSKPNNYDDMNILTPENLETLVEACAVVTDELIIDLSTQCDKRVQRIFEIADTVLLVCDSSSASRVKLNQFINQHNVFQRIRNKTVLVNNKGAKVAEPLLDKNIWLPFVQSTDAVSVYKTLSANNFDW